MSQTAAKGPITVTDLGTNGNTAGATITLTTTATCGAGNSIVILLAEAGGTVATLGAVADSVSNSYSYQANGVPNNTAADGRGGISFAWNVTALPSGSTITYTKATSGHRAALSALCALNTRTVSTPVDSVATPATVMGSSASPSITSGTPQSTGELFVGGLYAFGAASDTFSQASGWAAPPDKQYVANNPLIAGGNLISSSLSTETYAPTITSRPWVIFMLVLRQ
jgi:hypothetical protein